jgi:hypothetical protein
MPLDYCCGSPLVPEAIAPGIPLKRGDKDILVVEPDATKISYTRSRSESPTVKVAVTDTGAEYAFEIAGLSDQPGSTFNLSLPPEGGTLNWEDVGAARASTVNFKMTRSNERGVQTFNHSGIALAAGSTAQIQFGIWTTSSQAMPITTTNNGQQSAQTLNNQGP